MTTSNASNVRSVEYFYATMEDVPGQAAQLLTLLSEGGVDMLAFSIVPTGPAHTQLMMFPSAPAHLQAVAKRAQLELVGPQFALLVQGDNELGALVELHESLADAGINIYASSGVAATEGGFGYVVYVRPEDFKKAATVAGVPNVKSWVPKPPGPRS
jgi:hypothetical protein